MADSGNSEMVERVARAIYDATDPLSGDHIATVIVASEHLFPGSRHTEGNSSSKAYQLAAMDVCRSAARAAIEAMMEEDLKALLLSKEFDKMVGEPTPEGCREWFGSMDRRDGYGMFKGRGAHRYAYERENGPVPKGLVLDHICRNRRCVNHRHLRAVTNAENVLAGIGHTAVNAAKTHCWRGHPLEGENLYITPIGGRMCRECTRIADRAYKARRREALSPSLKEQERT